MNNTSFSLSAEPLRSELSTDATNLSLSTFGPINSPDSFIKTCDAIIESLRSFIKSDTESKRFEPFRKQISKAEASPESSIITTSWGGVVIDLIENTHIEKYLVVDAGKYLALEKHELKQEELEVIEGSGILLARNLNDPANELSLFPLLPGKKYSFAPGEEHCVIALENLLIFERSEDPKGMDQDLIFLYEAP